MDLLEVDGRGFLLISPGTCSSVLAPHLHLNLARAGLRCDHGCACACACACSPAPVPVPVWSNT